MFLSRSPPCEQGRPAWLGGGASRVEAARVGQAGAARPRREQDGSRTGLRVRLGSGNGCRRLSRAKGKTHYYRAHLLRWLGQLEEERGRRRVADSGGGGERRAGEAER